jgi:hypothetical protein
MLLTNLRKGKPVDKNNIILERLEISKHFSYLEINKMANVVVSPGPERPDREAVPPLTRIHGMVVKHREDSDLPGYGILSPGVLCPTSQRYIPQNQNP